MIKIVLNKNDRQHILSVCIARRCLTIVKSKLIHPGISDFKRAYKPSNVYLRDSLGENNHRRYYIDKPVSYRYGNNCFSLVFFCGVLRCEEKHFLKKIGNILGEGDV